MAVAWRFAEIGCKAVSLVKHKCTPEMGCICLEIGSCSAEIGYKCIEISITSFYICILLAHLNII